MKTRTSEKQKGFVLVVVAAILIVLIGFVALGVDTGALYSARTSAQEVADAAALAGAFTFVNDPTATQPATAINAATQVAINNSIMGKAVVATDVTVTADVVNQKGYGDCNFDSTDIFRKSDLEQHGEYQRHCSRRSRG